MNDSFGQTAEYLSDGDADCGSVEVSVFGGYEDERGDAAKNSMSLLRVLHDDPRHSIQSNPVHNIDIIRFKIHIKHHQIEEC